MSGLIPFANRSLATSGFEDLYNVLDDFFSFPSTRRIVRDSFKLDVEETDTGYNITAELPGVTKDELAVELTEEGRLVIAVNHSEDTEDKGKNYIHRERKVSSMSRSLFLGDTDPDSISAKLDNGILSLTVAKKPKESKSRKINIE